MRPPKGYDEFDGWNISIHGITPAQVKSSPRFAEAWPSILNFIGQSTLVAHNASFDIGVIREALLVSNLAWPNLRYACTLVLGRRVFELPSYSLSFVAEAAGIQWNEEKHHDAKYDALVAAKIVLSVAEKYQLSELQEIFDKFYISTGLLARTSWEGCHSNYGKWSPSRKAMDDIEINGGADPNHPFFGRHIVFTGTLHSMLRGDAWQAVASIGGIPEQNVSKKTNFLVFGDQEASKLRPGDTRSLKFQRAALLKDKGQEIKVITESDFLAQLQPLSGSLA